MNTFNLIGKVIDEPEKSISSNGISLCKLKIATKKNEKEEYDIYEVILFRGLADENYIVGDKLGITGKLQASNYEKDNINYYNCKLIGNSITKFD